MEDNRIDFEGANEDVKTTSSTGDTGANPANEPDTTSLNGGGTADITGKDNNTTTPPSPDNQQQTDDSTEEELTSGTQVEFDGKTYTVDDNGNIVDEEGNIFKEKKDVANWLKENTIDDSTEEDDTLSLENIQKEIGIEVTDDNGKPVELTNDAAGVKSYINSVINLKANEIQQGAINQFFASAPIVKEFVDYITLTGGDPRGFANIPDRSGIQLDQNNEQQLEAVIKMAGREFGNPNINDNYIAYLKSTGALYDEAKTQLEALVNKDKQLHQQIAEEAERSRQAEQAQQEEYWQNVAAIIAKRQIGEYKIPESFVKTVNGQKYTYTPNDFFNYMYRPIERSPEGEAITAYMKDIAKLSEEEYLNRQVLEAWLMFTGGSYKDLVEMASNEKEVRKLKIKSAEQRNAKTIKVVKPKSKVSAEDILF